MPMRMPTKGTGKDFEPIPAGTHLARFVRLVDRGTEPERPGMMYGPKRKLSIAWELPTVRREWEENGERQEGPALVWAQYTMSMNERALLRQMVHQLEGRAMSDEEAGNYDVAELLGRPCQVLIVHEPKRDGSGVWDNVSAVMPVPESFEVPEQETETVYFSMDPNEFSREVFESLGEGLRTRIAATDEYKLVADMQAVSGNLPKPPAAQYATQQPAAESLPYGDTPPPTDDDAAF